MIDARLQIRGFDQEHRTTQHTLQLPDCVLFLDSSCTAPAPQSGTRQGARSANPSAESVPMRAARLNIAICGNARLRNTAASQGGKAGLPQQVARQTPRRPRGLRGCGTRAGKHWGPGLLRPWSPEIRTKTGRAQAVEPSSSGHEACDLQQGCSRGRGGTSPQPPPTPGPARSKSRCHRRSFSRFASAANAVQPYAVKLQRGRAVTADLFSFPTATRRPRSRRRRRTAPGAPHPDPARLRKAPTRAWRGRRRGEAADTARLSMSVRGEI